MATRVLNVIKDRERLIGFRIICSKKNKGIHILSLKDAVTYIKTVENFENVKYVGNGNWEGIECGLSKFPIQNKVGEFKEPFSKWFVLGKMILDNKVVGFKLMDLMGNVSYNTVYDTLVLGESEGFINAKIVQKDDTVFIAALRGNLREFSLSDEVRKSLNLPENKGINLQSDDFKNPKIYSEPMDLKNPKKYYKDDIKYIDGDINNVKYDKLGDTNRMFDKEEQLRRYQKLAELFGKKANGEASIADIMDFVGAKTNTELSSKIHSYLGEPSSITDKDILSKLSNIFKSINTKNVKKENKNPDIKRMEELIKELTHAAEVYYSGEDEIMSNFEYDQKYDELEALEKKTGVILAGSLTQKVGFEIKSKLTKVKHASKMLSLDKTKDRQELANSLGGQPGFLGWKLDGLTCVVTYENGELVAAVTRGNGVIGEDVLHNVKVSTGVPMKISYKERLVVRCEALISYADFEKINAKITDVKDKYKNPRNLASGSIRQLDSKIAKERNIHLVAFTVVEGFDNLPNYTDKLEEIKKLGFDVVPYVKVTKDTTVKAIEWFEGQVKNYKYPTDGLVISIDDIAYGEMLGTTAKFPRNSKAFKWKDEAVESNMIDVEWSVGRTGAITPVAIFEPVDIEGSTVQRASVHNLSIFKKLALGQNDVVSIVKANLIIPQIVQNNTMSGTFKVPTICPVCGQPTTVLKDKDAEVLMCINPNCLARHLEGLSHFVSRDCMNIEGLSDATLEVFVNEKFIHTFKDIYHLNDYEKEIINLDGFGKGSYSKLWKAIEKSRECELPAFISALGIPQMGKTTSKDVCKALDYDLDRIINLSEAELQGIDGVGEKTAKEIFKYFSENKQMVLDLAKEMSFKVMPKINRNSPINGLTFCITGDVYTFKNRKELQNKIESLGGKASSSVSSKTNYLINNDITSGSNKNQTAKKLGVPIISEADFLKMIGE